MCITNYLVLTSLTSNKQTNSLAYFYLYHYVFEYNCSIGRWIQQPDTELQSQYIYPYAGIALVVPLLS